MRIRHLLLLAVLLIISCQDEMGPTNPQIVGVWNWIESMEGFAGQRTTPQTEGYTLKIRITLSGTYTLYKNDAVEKQARYRMEQKKFGEAGPFDVLIVEGDREMERTVSFRTRDTLVLTDTCIDCFQHTYVRIGE